MSTPYSGSNACGFRWLTPHNPCTEGGTSNAHECMEDGTHVEWWHDAHVCECGCAKPSERYEQSYREPEPLAAGR